MKHDALNVRAAEATAEQRFAEANRNLAEAYRIAVDSITRLQAGQTVASRLNFETPEQEYRYELDRFQSNEIFFDMMLREGRADERESAVVPRLDRAADSIGRWK